MEAIVPHEDGVLIRLRVQPRASRTSVSGVSEGTIRMRVAAPPVEGAANWEIIAWLSKQLSVPKSTIRIVHGARGRTKSVYVPGVTVSEVLSGIGPL